MKKTMVPIPFYEVLCFLIMDILSPSHILLPRDLCCNFIYIALPVETQRCVRLLPATFSRQEKVGIRFQERLDK